MTARTMLRSINSVDHRLMRRVHRWRPPRWIRLWMLYATRGGNGGLWFALGAILLLFGGDARLPAIASAACAAGVGIALFRCLKKAIGRPRPCHVEPHCWANLLPPDQFSFPSGHSITSFAVAVSVGLSYPDALLALLFAALSVAVSRILLGMHYLSDVLAGSLLGILLGYSSYLLFT